MRQVLAFIGRAALSAAFLYIALTSVDFGILTERLHDVKFQWLLGGLALAGAQLVLLSSRWWRIALACGAPLSLGRAVRVWMVGMFFGQLLPTTVGGDALRTWMLARAGAGWSKATYSVLIDRFVGILTLAIVVSACLPWTLALIQDPVGRAAMLVIASSCIAGAAVFLSFSYLRWKWLDRCVITRHPIRLAETARIVLTSRRTAVPVIVLSFVTHALSAGVAWCAAHAIDASIGYFRVLQIVPPVTLIAMIPISIAGWGVREKSFMLAFAYAGLPKIDGLLVSLIVGMMALVIGACGGIVWLAGEGSSVPAKTRGLA